MKGTTLLSDFLTALGVRHTAQYSDAAFMGMPFKSLFGLSRLLTQYGVASQAIMLSDKTQLTKLDTPFLAQEGSAFVIVNSISDGAVDYTLYHDKYHVGLQQFIDKFTGVVLLAFPDENSIEPNYGRHHFYTLAASAKTLLLAVSAVVLLVFALCSTSLCSHISLILLLLTDLAGLAVCYMLMLKTLKIKSHTADRFCGILQKHGCDTVLEQKASTFFGLFSWSEVGLAYFVISTLILLISPDSANYLAIVNACCLPFTVWSISYQKFVIKTWCTLCVTVQSLLWCQFLCLLLGGWFVSGTFSFLTFIAIAFAYLGTMLLTNRIRTGNAVPEDDPH